MCRHLAGLLGAGCVRPRSGVSLALSQLMLFATHRPRLLAPQPGSVRAMTDTDRGTQTQLTFRAANEQIEARRVELGVEGRVPYLCECADERCLAVVRLWPQEYRAARVSERHFLLLPGHSFVSATIVSRCDRYIVVEKTAQVDAIEREEACVDERQERIARNEALFRHINERLEELNDAFASMTQSFEVVCECGAIDCIDQARLTAAEYERVRADPTLFIICVGISRPTSRTLWGPKRVTRSCGSTREKPRDSYANSTSAHHSPSDRRVSGERTLAPVAAGRATQGASTSQRSGDAPTLARPETRRFKRWRSSSAFKQVGLTATQYESVGQTLEQRGHWPPKGLLAHVCFGGETIPRQRGVGVAGTAAAIRAEAHAGAGGRRGRTGGRAGVPRRRGLRVPRGAE